MRASTRFFMFIMILSTFFLSQRNVLSNLSFEITFESIESIKHTHEHNVINILKFVFSGFALHTHDHNHDDSESHETNAHSHSGTVQLKSDFITSQNLFLFSNEFQLTYGLSASSLINYDQPFQIFRPPILA